MAGGLLLVVAAVVPVVGLGVMSGNLPLVAVLLDGLIIAAIPFVAGLLFILYDRV